MRTIILILIALFGFAIGATACHDAPELAAAESSLTTVRVLHIHVNGAQTAPDHETVTVGTTVFVGFSDDDQLQEAYSPEIDLKTGLGLYKTAIEINAEVADAVKALLYSERGIPTNGYAATYVSGAYGLLNVL